MGCYYIGDRLLLTSNQVMLTVHTSVLISGKCDLVYDAVGGFCLVSFPTYVLPWGPGVEQVSSTTLLIVRGDKRGDFVITCNPCLGRTRAWYLRNVYAATDSDPTQYFGLNSHRLEVRRTRARLYFQFYIQ